MELKMIIGIFIGGALGYLYYKKIGCSSGTCPITSSARGSTIYGALIGLLLSNAVWPG